MPNQRLRYLFDVYTKGNSTASEKRELYALALALKNEADVQELLDEYWDSQTIEFGMPEEKSEEILQSILGSEMKVVPSIHRIHFHRLRWWAAASIVLMLGLGSYFIFFNKSTKGDEIVKIAEPAKDVKAPETNRAMIRLADGRTVYLDSAANGQLAQQGNINLIKLANGQIAYETAIGEIVKEIQYNTLSNPRGSKAIDMILSDGSHVWLNSASSITYPIAFVDNDRKVSITGEAYFEVAHDANKPFFVSKNDVSVQVIGTHFNVNAYDDENDIKITLLEGSVKVSKGNSIRMLKPGQQAKISGEINVTNGIDTDEVMAWKNGKFSFNRANIQTVMRQLARWYDLDVEYRGELTKDLFLGDMQRNLPLSKVLEFLKKSQVHFEVEGKKVTVLR